jgi:hypothetical protein
MKRLILLAVCIAAVFAFVPSHADPICPVNTLGTEACYQQYGPYDACFWGNGVASSGRTCIDSNGDSGYEAYLDLYLNNYAQVTHVWKDHNGGLYFYNNGYSCNSGGFNPITLDYDFSGSGC